MNHTLNEANIPTLQHAVAIAGSASNWIETPTIGVPIAVGIAVGVGVGIGIGIASRPK